MDLELVSGSHHFLFPVSWRCVETCFGQHRTHKSLLGEWIKGLFRSRVLLTVSMARHLFVWEQLHDMHPKSAAPNNCSSISVPYGSVETWSKVQKVMWKLTCVYKPHPQVSHGCVNSQKTWSEPGNLKMCSNSTELSASISLWLSCG